MGTGMWAQMLVIWHRVRTGHNEAGPYLGDEDKGVMKRGTGTRVQCLGTWHRPGDMGFGNMTQRSGGMAG